MGKTLKRELILTGGSLLAAFIGVQAFAAVQVEVVQSVPIETTLAASGVRKTQEVWLEMIKGAQSTIDLEEFYIEDKSGEAMSPVLAAIREAAKRGVRVRLLVDLKFFKNYPKAPTDLSRVPNIQVRTIDFGSGVQHAKYFVVDGGDTYVGSANFDRLALSHIHELGLRVKDSAASQKLESVFEKDWKDGVEIGEESATGKLNPIDGSSLNPDAIPGMKVVASPPAKNPDGMSDSLPAMIDLLDSAQKSLKIQLYQYSTKPSHGSGKWLDLDSAIRRAAKRGVEVQLMVDAVALKAGSVALKALATVDHIKVRVVRIPEWSGGHLDYARLIHSKYFTLDGTASWIGTENWSENYFTNSRNVGVILSSKEVAVKVGEVFDRVWSSAYASGL